MRVKKYGIFIEQIDGVICTDDGFSPFSNDSYKLHWKGEDTSIINYSFGSEDIWKTEIIRFK